MTDQFEVIVIGMAPGGEVAASRVHQAALAIRARIPIDSEAQFPAYTEGYLSALEKLAA